MTFAGKGEQRTSSLDDRIIHALAIRIFPENRPAAKFLAFCSFFASGAVVYPIYPAVYLLCSECRRMVMQIALADLCAFAVVVLLKYAVHRQRPEKGRNCRYLGPWNRFSFPSGHTARAFAVAGTITIAKPAYGVAAIPIAALIGLSRITLCRHYPSDVLGGMIVGGAAAVVAAVLRL